MQRDMSEDGTAPQAEWERLWDLFHRALEHEEGGRRAFLAQACGDDAALRSRIELLLETHHKSGGVLDASPITDGPDGGLGLDDERGLEPGQVLGGRFGIVRELGRGGMGSVYEAEDRELGGRVAVKLLRSAIAADATARERFRREIQLARQVTHRNVCRLFDLEQDGPLLFLTMELLEGETLHQRIRREGPLPENEALAIAGQVASALEAAHTAGVVHRDLKSGNVLLVPEQGGTRAVVTDFGLATSAWVEGGESEIEGDARATGAAASGRDDDAAEPARQASPAPPAGRRRLTRAGQLLGTPATMAPEQLEGGEITPATDVYAFGLLLCEMVTGALPGLATEADGPGGEEGAAAAPIVAADLAPRWERAIRGCLARRPSDRTSSPTAALAMLLAEAPPGTAGATAGHRRRGVAVATAALLILVGVATWIRWGAADPAAAGASLAFEERDWVLVGDFDNRTGEELFDGAVEAALARELAASRFVNVVPRPRIQDALRLMRQPLTAALDRAVGREVCLRDGGIRALLTGRVERLGERYVVSVALVAPEDGHDVAVYAEEAVGQDEVPAAVRRLAGRVRHGLGEDVAEIRASEAELARVTTPSLRALKLYSEADRVIATGREGNLVAEQLLRQAIAVDPDFASGYIHLAHALGNTGRQDEARVAALQAVALADQVSDTERYFILGSYEHRWGDFETGLRHYETLLRLDPDHYWASNNLLGSAAIWRPSVQGLLRQRVQVAGPDEWWLHYLDAKLELDTGSLDEASRQVEMALGKVEPGWLGTNVYNHNAASWMRFYPVHGAWLAGDVEAAAAAIDDLVASFPPLAAPEIDQRNMQALPGLAATWYANLGMDTRALAVSERFRPPEVMRFWRGLLADERGDRGAVLRYFSASFSGRSGNGERIVLEPERIVALAESGRPDLARAGLDEMRGYQEPGMEPALDVLAGIVTGAEGRHVEAIAFLAPLLPRLVDGLARLWGYELSGAGLIFWAGSRALSRAYEATGESEHAVEVLEWASAFRARSYRWAGSAWLRNQIELAGLYRRQGRPERAEPIEDEVRSLLRLADPECGLLRRLEEAAATRGTAG